MVARLSLYIMVAVLILLFALTFAVLGKGHYQPQRQEPEQGEEHAYSYPEVDTEVVQV